MSVRSVESAPASTTRGSRQKFPPRDSRESGSPSKRLSAPSINAAAIPRPSPIPPAAITGIGATASTTAGTRGSVAAYVARVPAGFGALSDNHVDAAVGGAERVGDGADLAQHRDVCVARAADMKGSGSAKE